MLYNLLSDPPISATRKATAGHATGKLTRFKLDLCFPRMLGSPCALLALLLLSQLALVCSASQKTLPGQSAPVPLDWSKIPPTDPKGLPPRQAWVDAKAATIYLVHVEDLINATIGGTRGVCRGPGPKSNGEVVTTIHECGAAYDTDGKLTGKSETANFPGPNDYIILHLVAWKDPAKGATTQDVDKQNWYAYNNSSKWDDTAFATNSRIFGKKAVYLFYMHFNRGAGIDYNVNYEMQVTSKIPAFLDHLLQLGQVWGVKTTGSGPTKGGPSDVFGMIGYHVDAVPSDLSVTPKILDATDGHSLSSLDAKKFDNEGKYHTDFSVAVPITKITDLTYASTSNSLAPAQITKQRLLAVFDFHPWAFDVKGSGFSPYPYLVTGVGLGSQPLQRALFGGAWGPAYANFYAGLLLNTQHLPAGGSCGKTPTAAQLQGTIGTKTCKEFSFGLNVGVGSVLDAIKNNNGSKSAQTTAAPKQP